MKRFVIATASALIVLAGSAAAVPAGSAARLPHENPSVPQGVPYRIPDVDPSVVPDPGSAIPGLPADVTQLLGAVDPALANLAETVAAPVTDALSPVITAPAPTGLPGLTPEEPQKPAEQKSGPARKQAKGPTRRADLQAAAAGDPLATLQALPANGYAAYGTASVIHAHALQVGDQRLENTDVAFSGATFSSAQLPELKNEMARIINPALTAGNAYGRGSGVEVGLGIGQSDPNQIVPGSIAEAKAPPSTPLVSKQVPTVDVPGALKADLLRGEAQAKANSICTTGTDLSYGLGYAANLGLIGSTVASAAPSPDRAVSQSKSHTFLVPQEGTPTPVRKFGLASETRQTIAPVTLFKGTPNEVTLEFAGEWVLRTVADGKAAVKLFYGPGNVTPDTPILRILQPSKPVQEILSTQALFGAGGLVIPLSPVLKVTIGTPPRAISGDETSKPTETATLVSAAVDVVRVTLLSPEPEGTLTAADVRIGHMENAVAVPAGGIECRMGLSKVSDKEVIAPGDTFSWTITVTNLKENDCVVSKLKVVDTITADPGIKWTVDSSTPSAGQMSKDGVTWNDLGTLMPGESRDVKIQVTVAKDSGGGRFLDEAVATGTCGPAAGTAGAETAVGVPLEARVSLNVPEVALALGALLPRELPRTGGMLAVLPALALTGGGLVLRRVKRRKHTAA